MKRIWLVLALVGLAVPALAQDKPSGLRDLGIALPVYAAAATLDLHSTYQVLQWREGTGPDGLPLTYRRRETNPLGSWLDGKPRTFVAFSAAADVAAVYALSKVVKNRRLAKTALYGTAALRLWFAARNYHRAAMPPTFNATR